MKCGDFTFTKDRTYKEIIGFFYEPKYICKESSVIWKEKMCCFFPGKTKWTKSSIGWLWHAFSFRAGKETENEYSAQ